MSDGKVKCVKKKLATVPVIGKIFTPKDKVVVMRMAGVIADSSNTRKAGISFQKYTKLIDKAFGIDNVKALALVINSPGGAPTQCALISNQIQRLSKEKEVPVYAFVEDVAASGGYWLACTADKIYAQETSIIGSIGVISGGFGFTELIQRHGIERRIYTSGKDKSFLDPFTEEKPADVKRLKKLQSQLHESFKNWVKESRGDRLNGTDAVLMEGGFWVAPEAIEKGIIDELGDVTEVMKSEFGEKVKFIEMSPEKKMFAGLIPFGAEAKIDGEILIDALDVMNNRALWTRYGL